MIIKQRNQKQKPNHETNSNLIISRTQKREIYLLKSIGTGPYSVYVENISENFTGKLNATKIEEII